MVLGEFGCYFLILVRAGLSRFWKDLVVFLFDTSRRIFMLEVVDVMAYIIEDSMVVIFVDIMVDWRLLY